MKEWVWEDAEEELSALLGEEWRDKAGEIHDE